MLRTATVKCLAGLVAASAATGAAAVAGSARETSITLPLAGHLERRCTVSMDSGTGLPTGGSAIVSVSCNYGGVSALEVIGPTMNSIGGEPGSTTLTLLELVSAEGLTRLTFELASIAGTATPPPASEPEPTPEADPSLPDALRRLLFGERRSGTATLTPN